MEKWKNVGKGARNKTRRSYNATRYTTRHSCNNHQQPEPYTPVHIYMQQNNISKAMVYSQLKNKYLEAVTLKNKLYVRKTIIE